MSRIFSAAGGSGPDNPGRQTRLFVSVEQRPARADYRAVARPVKGVLHVLAVGPPAAVAGHQEKESVILPAEADQKVRMGAGNHHADIGVAAPAELFAAPAHGQIHDHLVEHPVAGEQILHLPGGLVGGAGLEEEALVLGGVGQKGLDRVAALVGLEAQAVAGQRGERAACPRGCRRSRPGPRPRR